MTEESLDSFSQKTEPMRVSSTQLSGIILSPSAWSSRIVPSGMKRAGGGERRRVRRIVESFLNDRRLFSAIGN